MTDTTVARIVPDLLLVIFIHGFKGDDQTFAAFPERLQHVLSETIPNVIVECTVFPAYEVRRIVLTFIIANLRGWRLRRKAN